VADAVAVPRVPELALQERQRAQPPPAEGMDETAPRRVSDDAARGAAHGGAPATAAYRARAPQPLRFTQGAGNDASPMCATDSAPAGPGLAPLPGPAPLVRPLSYPIGTLRRRWPRSRPPHRPPPRRRSSSCPRGHVDTDLVRFRIAREERESARPRRRRSHFVPSRRLPRAGSHARYHETGA
jgi:hypothetical protein